MWIRGDPKEQSISSEKSLTLPLSSITSIASRESLTLSGMGLGMGGQKGPPRYMAFLEPNKTYLC